MSDSPYTKLNREEIAEMEVGKTSVSRSMSVALVAAFILTIVSVPATQHFIEIRAGFAESRSWVLPAAYKIFDYFPRAWAALVKPANEDLLNRLTDANAVLTSGFKTTRRTSRATPSLRVRRFPMRRHSPRNFWVWETNRSILGANAGSSISPTSPILRGRDFLILFPAEPDTQRRFQRDEESVQPDPLKAIVQFRDQLKSRGIHLIIMPIPVKPMIEPEFLSRVLPAAAADSFAESVLWSFSQALGESSDRLC